MSWRTLLWQILNQDYCELKENGGTNNEIQCRSVVPSEVTLFNNLQSYGKHNIYDVKNGGTFPAALFCRSAGFDER